MDSGSISTGEIRAWLVTNIAAVLELDPSAIDTSQELYEYGLDSMQSIGLSGDLGRWLKTEIEPTAIWAYPTIDSLSDYLERIVARRLSE